MSNVFLRSVLVLAVGAAAASASAQSQQAPRVIHVYRGLFGPTEVEDNLSERLYMSLSVYGAGDDSSRFATGTDIADETLQARRFYQGAQAQAAYRRERPRSILTVDGSSALRYYSQLHDVTTLQAGGTVTEQYVPAPRWKIQFGGGSTYSPYYQLQLGQPSGGGPLPAPGQDFSVGKQKMISYGALGSVTYAPGRHTELLLMGGGRYAQFVGAPDYSARSAGVRFTRRLSRDFALRLGYTQGVEGRSDLEPTTIQNIDAGLNFNRGISFSPRTSIGFSTGSAIVSTVNGRHFQLLGAVYLKHQLSPRWTAQAAVDRGLQSVESAARPFVASSVNGGVTGYLTRRVGLRWFPSYARGVDVAFGETTYNSFSNQARLEIALSRFWAVYVEHFYYRYQFSGNADLRSALPGLTRQGARAGLTLWAPVVR